MNTQFSQIFPAVCVLAAASLGAAPDRPWGCPRATEWLADFSFYEEVPAVGDFNGDGLDDVVNFLRSTQTGSPQGDALVSLNSGSGSFGAATLWHPWFGIGNETLRVGDFDGDGRDDVATFLHGSGGVVYVALSNGTTFDPSSIWVTGFATGKGVPHIGDFDGDGLDDVASFDNLSGEVRVALSTGSGFVLDGTWLGGLAGAVAVTGDFNGDGLDDIGAVLPGSGQLGTVDVGLSKGFEFATPERWMEEAFFDTGSEVFSADFTADGADDLALVSRLGALWVAPTEGDSFHYDPSAVVWNHRIRRSGQICLAGRFNRDRNADLVVFESGIGVGDVLVSLTGGHAPELSVEPECFGYGTMATEEGVLPQTFERPPLVEIPLVLGVFDFGDRPDFGTPLGRDDAFFDQLYFGPGAPNLRDWFLEMSQGTFAFSRAGSLFLELSEVPDQVEDPDNPGEFITGDARPQMVQAMADAGFDFRLYDGDGNGIVEPPELCIATVSNFGEAAGQTITVDTVIEYDDGGLSEIRVRTRFAGADHLGAIDLYAHETAHILHTVDLYSSSCYNQDASLMHCNAGTGEISSLVHLDAWHKVRLGWELPRIFDLRDGPSMTTLDAAQLAGRAPVLIHDSVQGLEEYYLFEYRSPMCTLGQQVWDGQDADLFRMPDPPRGGFRAAGYDTNFHSGGVAPWFVRMEHPERVAKEYIGINHGGDDILDSTPLGDDVLIGDRIDPGPDLVLQSTLARGILPGADEVLDTTPAGDDVISAGRIHPGPDDVLDSVPAGDDQPKNLDGFSEDVMVFLARDPNDHGARGSTDHLVGNARQSFNWQGSGKDFELKVRMNSVNTASIAWGAPFRPFIETWPTGEVKAGTVITLNGKFGPLSFPITRAVLRCVETGVQIPLETELWSPTVVALQVPQLMAGGEYALYFEDTSSPQLEVQSNTISLTIEDSWGLWLAEHFTPTEIADPAVTGLEVDLDHDGLTTIAEFAAKGDPHVADPDLQPSLVLTATRVEVRVPLRRDLSGVEVRLETGIDLVDWFFRSLNIDETLVLSDPDLAVYTRGFLRGGAPNQRLFYRLGYTLATK